MGRVPTLVTLTSDSLDAADERHQADDITGRVVGQVLQLGPTGRHAGQSGSGTVSGRGLLLLEQKPPRRRLHTGLRSPLRDVSLEVRGHGGVRSVPAGEPVGHVRQTPLDREVLLGNDGENRGRVAAVQGDL